MEKRMSRFGVGPKWAAISIIYGIFTIIPRVMYSELFRIDFFPILPRVITGSVLILLGIIVYILGIKEVMTAYNAKQLGTKGILSLCRNPIYAAWVVFIIPGAMLLANTWIGLTIIPFMYISLRIMIKKEEVFLEKEFGEEYLDYKKRVPAVIPLGRFASLS